MIAVTDIAYVRYHAPDLAEMASFYEDFGMLKATQTKDAADTIYLRGYGDAPFINVIERGAPASIGMGFYAESADDLERLAREQGTTVEQSQAPGGGQVVRLKDPAGFLVEVVHGFTPAEPVAQRESVPGNNTIKRERYGQTVRSQPEPAQIQRIGHLVVSCPNLEEMLAFYTQVLGFTLSDGFYDGAPENLKVAFLRCGLGDRWTDHHTLALAPSRDGKARFGHSAFEVTDLDDLVQGSEYLKRRGHRHSWGVGRHILGSQIFDYWRDPVANHVEHWTDGDLVNDSVPPTLQQIGTDTMHQWGPEVPPVFFELGPTLQTAER